MIPTLFRAALLSCALLRAQDPTPVSPTPAPTPATAPEAKAQEPKTPSKQGAEPEAPKPQSMEQALAKYHPKAGKVNVGKWATVALADGWQWLEGRDAQQFLRDLGNRPGSDILGVALPGDFASSEVFAVYYYADEGHVDDGETPDYDQLLVDMKEGAVEENTERKKQGLPGVQLIGWAEPPHYDKTQRKLYWAKQLRFDDNEGDTLNYNVRVLGRTGHLVVNGVGGMEQLELVAKHSKALLAATEFVAGQRYEDFDSNVDKVAAYGIGGLIAGGVLLKSGLFAKLLLLLKVAIKPILIGVVAIGAFVAKLFAGRKKRDDAARQ